MVSSHRGRGVLHVADRATGKVLFTQDLDDEWFEHGLTSRAVWAAAHTAPTSRGTRVEAELETKSDDNGQVLGWSVTLSSGGTPFFRRARSTDVLRATAAVVSRQCRGTHGDGQVLYWVHCGDADYSSHSGSRRSGNDGHADEGPDRPPRRAAVVALPLDGAGDAAEPSADDARLVRRDNYRIARRFSGHGWLTSERPPEGRLVGDGTDGGDHHDEGHDPGHADEP